MVVTQNTWNYLISTDLRKIIKSLTFLVKKSIPPKIIKNRLNFAPTYVYTKVKIQVSNKKLAFFKIFYLKSTPLYLVIIISIVTIRYSTIIMLGTDAVAVYGFHPTFR